MRDSQEETGKRLYKLERGAIVNAFERAIGDDNMLRYRIDDGSDNGGWVSFCRSSTSTEPQIEVIDTFKSDEAVVAKQMADFEARRVSVSMQKKFDFHKVSNVSPRRAGFMTFFHFHSVMRHALSSLAWICSPVQQSALSLNAESRSSLEYTCKILPLICNTLIRLLPPLPSHVPPLQPPDVENALSTNDEMSSSFFASLSVPDIATYNIAKTFRTIHVVELCHYFLYEESKSFRGDPNLLLLIHLYYGGFIERLAMATSLVFLTCIREPDAAVSPSAGGAGQTVYEGNRLQSILDYKPPAEDPAEDDDEDDEDVEADETLSVTERAEKVLKKKIRDRRVLAVSNIDIVIDLWQNFFKGFSSDSRVSSGFMDITDATHAFDPPVFKRKLFMTLVRYIDQAWTHDKLHTLPPTTVKNVLELVHVVIKSLLGAKEYPLRSRVRSTSSGGRNRPQLTHTSSIRDASTSEGDSSQAEFPDIAWADLVSDDEVSTRPSSRSLSWDAGIMQRSRGLRDRFSLYPAVADDAAMARWARGAASGSWRDNEEMEAPLAHMLPLIHKSTDDELRTDKAIMFGLYKHTYTAVPPACLKLIERGIHMGGVQWRSEAAMLNKSFTREFTTVMVLTQMLKCMERPKWSDGTLKVVLLISLYPRVVTLLEGGLTPQICSSLYGLLHAILLLLSGKVMSPMRSSTKSNEMIFLVFGMEGRFKVYHCMQCGVMCVLLSH